METRVGLDVPAEGCCFNYVQAGLVVYGDDDNFIKLTEASIWETRQTEFAKELSPVPEGWSRYGNTVVGPPVGVDVPAVVVERLHGTDAARGRRRHRAVHRLHEPGRRDLGARRGVDALPRRRARIGLVSMGGPGAYPVRVDEVLVWSLRGGRPSR